MRPVEALEDVWLLIRGNALTVVEDRDHSLSITHVHGRLDVPAFRRELDYLLPPLLAAFQARYPGVEVSLHLANSPQDELVLVVAPAHVFAKQETIAATDLSGITLVVREAGSGTRRVLEDELEQVGVSSQRTLELNGCEAVKRAAMAGLGVAVVSACSVTLELRCGELVRLSVPELHLERDLYIVPRKDVRPSAAALAFLSLVRKTRH